MTISKLGLTLIKEFEQFSATVYKDAGGKDTIGWGHLIKEGEKLKEITEAEATTILADDLKMAEKVVSDSVTVPLSQWQYDALTSLVFNVGQGNFNKSTLLTCLNKGLYALAADEFMRWVYVGVNKMAGLTARRRAEKIIFKAGSEESQTAC